MAQSDSLVFKDNRQLVGELKSMQSGVLMMKTDFSKEDFKVKWNEVKEVYSNSMFIVYSKSRSRQYGTLSSPENGMLKITMVRDEEEVIYPIDEIIYIKSQDDKFLDRISAGMDFGFTLTRARNQRQLSTRSRLGYYDESRSFDASFK